MAPQRDQLVATRVSSSQLSSIVHTVLAVVRSASGRCAACDHRRIAALYNIYIGIYGARVGGERQPPAQRTRTPPASSATFSPPSLVSMTIPGAYFRVPAGPGWPPRPAHAVTQLRRPRPSKCGHSTPRHPPQVRRPSRRPRCRICARLASGSREEADHAPLTLPSRTSLHHAARRLAQVDQHVTVSTQVVNTHAVLNRWLSSVVGHCGGDAS